MAETTTKPVRREAMLLPGEQVVVTIRKHLIGIILLYLEVLVGAGAILAFIIITGPDIFVKNGNYAAFTAISIFAVALLAFILFIATYIYRQSKIVVTNKSLIQTLQKGLFYRKVSRLSMADVEDVTADQNGILPSLFNYGTLIIETAGEIENFIFPYCPDPNKYATLILETRQQFLEEENKP